MAAAKKTSIQQQKKEQRIQAERKKIATAQVTDLKDKIMAEVHKQEQPAAAKAPIAPQPVITPDNKRDGVTPPPAKHTYIKNINKQDAVLTAMLTVAVVLIIGLLMWGQQTTTSSPAQALQNLEKALAAGDMDALQANMDEERVANSLVEQFYTDLTFNPSELPEDLQAKVPSGTEAEIAAMVKPGLAENLQADVQAFITGKAKAEDLPQDLFSQIWAGLSNGQPLTYKGVRNVVADNDVARMDILLERPDLRDPFTLALRFENTANGWQLVELPSLPITLATVAELENAPTDLQIAQVEAPAPVTAPVPTPVPAAERITPPAPMENAVKTADLSPNQVLQVEGARKISVSGTAAEDSILITLKLRNNGPQDVTAFNAEVVFTDAAGQPLKSFSLSDAVGVTRGMRLEKTWRIPVDISQRMDHHVYRLPQEAMQVFVLPKQVEFADGAVIKG